MKPGATWKLEQPWVDDPAAFAEDVQLDVLDWAAEQAEAEAAAWAATSEFAREALRSFAEKLREKKP